MYTKEEITAQNESERDLFEAELEWDVEDMAKDFRTKPQHNLDGFICDTRDWLYTNTDDILNMNKCKPIQLSTIEQIQYNAYISANNFKR